MTESTKTKLGNFALTLLSIIAVLGFLFFWIWFPINLSAALESVLQSAQVRTAMQGQIGGPQMLLVVEILVPVLIVTMAAMTIYTTLREER